MELNPIVYTEVSVSFARIEDLDDALPAEYFRRDALPWVAGFLAGKCFVTSRRRGGSRASPLPDFYIGTHAVVAGMALLTRDPVRYRTYFPKLRLIAPQQPAYRAGPTATRWSSVRRKMRPSARAGLAALRSPIA